MKKILTFIACIVSFAAIAQTNSVTDTNSVITGPAGKIITFLGEGSNYIIAPYGIYDTGSKSFGGGIGIGYKLNDFVVPTIRLDYINKDIWMPSGNVQLQAPMTLFNKVTTIPFVFAGAATTVSGRGSQNGEAVGIFGVGMAVRIGKHWDVVGDWEQWSTFKGDQYRFGFAYKF